MGFTSQGFEFIDYVKFGWNRYRALWTPYVGSRLLWADSIYMKDPRRIAERGLLLLRRAAFIAHVNYRKYDLAAHLLHLYDEQCGSALKDSYAASFRLNPPSDMLPIVYLKDVVSDFLQRMFWYNPVYPFIRAFHDLPVHGQVPRLGIWAAMAVWAVGALIAGVLFVRRTAARSRMLSKQGPLAA